MRTYENKIKYILSDIGSAALAWIIFNVFRKQVIESAVFGKAVSLNFNLYFVFGTFVIVCFWISIYFFLGYYYKINRKSRLQEFSQTLVSSLLGNLILFFIIILDDVNTGYKDYYLSVIVLTGLHFTLTYIPRSILTSLAIVKIRKGKIAFNTLVIGSNQKALEIINSFTAQDLWAGFRFVGYIGLNSDELLEISKQCPFLGTIENMDSVIKANKIEEVIIAVEKHEHAEIEGIISRLQLSNVSIRIIPDLFEILIGKTELALIDGTPLISVASLMMPVWEKNVKFFIDKTVSLIVLTVFSPLYLFTALGVLLSSKGSIIYKQKRVGLNGREFTIYKFRSMYRDAEKDGPELSSANDMRVTSFGQFMRRTRLDEIPQFFNVLKGDMSLVGPRPERRFYIDQIVEKAPEYMLLLKIRPGITSLGQVKYGYAENIDQMLKRLKYDIIYLKNMSLYFDFMILIYTVLTIVKQNGK